MIITNEIDNSNIWVSSWISVHAHEQSGHQPNDIAKQTPVQFQSMSASSEIELVQQQPAIQSTNNPYYYCSQLLQHSGLFFQGIYETNLTNITVNQKS